MSDPAEVADPDYVEGLKLTVAAAVDFGIESIDHGETPPPLVPPQLLSQARLAARNGISLDTVLRRYFAGYCVLGDFVIAEAETLEPAAPAAMKGILRTQARLFDHLIASVSENYMEESAARHPTAAGRRAEQVKRLLAGEQLDATALAYDFECWHLALAAEGRDAKRAINRLASLVDRRLLSVPVDERGVWAWLGGRHAFTSQELAQIGAQTCETDTAVTIGEPGEGIRGWRFSHRQARAALPVARHRGGRITRYGEVSLIASVIQDDLLATSLKQLFLLPLKGERDGGEASLTTLRAYFEAGRHLSSAGAALGINRNTVANRLRKIELRLGRSLDSCAAEIETLLRLEELDRAANGAGPRQFGRTGSAD